MRSKRTAKLQKMSDGELEGLILAHCHTIRRLRTLIKELDNEIGIAADTLNNRHHEQIYPRP